MFSNVNEKQSQIPSEVLGKVLNSHFEETFTIPVPGVVFKLPIERNFTEKKSS